MTELIFEEPPRRTGPGAGNFSPLRPWLASLREHPGVWARYPETVAAGIGTAIKQGLRYGVAPGEFEAQGKMADEPGRQWLYARFVGES